MIRKSLALAFAAGVAFPAAALAEAPKQKAVVSAAFKSVLYLPVYVADELGYFRDQGLDVRIDVASSSTNALASVISKSADFSLHGPEWTVISASKGGQVKVIGGTLGRLGAWLSCKADANIKGVKDLKGKVVSSGAMPTTSTSAFINILKQNGLDANKDIRLIEVPMGSEIGPLAAGQADCAVLYEPGGSQAEDQGFKVAIPFAEEMGPYTFSAISTRKDIDPEIARKFLAGMDKALKQIHADPSKAVEIGQKLFPNMKPSVVKASVERLIKSDVIARSVALPPEALKAALKTQIDLGNLKEAPAQAKWLDDAAASKIAAETGK